MSRLRSLSQWFTSQDGAELVATVVLAIAAVSTAWSGFQSAKWSGEQAIAFSEASAARTESARASATAGQLTQIDVGLFVDWLSALNDDLAAARIQLGEGAVYEPDRSTLSGFLFLRFREEFVPAVEAWFATAPLSNPGAPGSPFEMPEYQLEATRLSVELLEQAERRAADARQFNQNSDNYVLTSVMFALILFFAGVSTKLRRERARALMLGMAVAGLVAGAVVLVVLPIHPIF